MKHRVFISYSWSDAEIAIRIRNAIPADFDTWIDRERLKPGDSISQEILRALSGSDYYIILISENSVNSNWVQREIATAFELSTSKKISIVPILLNKVEVPLEFRGLLYLDFRTSVDAGLDALRLFFAGQASKIDDIEPRHKMLKSESDVIVRRRACNEALRQLRLGDLRYLAVEKLTLADVEVVWFDLFDRKMSDEVSIRNISLSCVELIDRSRREDVIVDLLDIFCRNHPHISKGL